RNRDTAVFAMTDKDWPAIDAAYEDWLDPGNFGETGGQRRRLSETTAPLLRSEAPPPPEGFEANALGQPLDRHVNGFAPPPRPAKAPMEGRYVRLEPLDPDRHASDLFAAYEGADPMWDYMPCGPFADLDAYRSWVEAEGLGDDPLFFAVVDRADGAAKGVASYLRINPDHGSIEVGFIAFSPSMQGTRLSTEAMYLMMAEVFALGYRRYEWKCNALNAPSRRAASRLGFVYEGDFAQAVVTKGRNRDTSWFGLLAADWPARKAAFEAWLDPSNFDEAGRQKTPLA
ncbi:MAG: GNAT family protein, partial [Pseudomonadota bacterium]